METITIKKTIKKTWKCIERILEVTCSVALTIGIIYLVWNFLIDPSIEKQFKTYEIYGQAVYNGLKFYDLDSEWDLPSARQLPADAVWTGHIGVIYNGQAFEEEARVTIVVSKNGNEYYAEPSKIQFMTMGLECDYNDIFTREALMDIYEVLLGVSDSAAISFTNSYGGYDVLTVTDLQSVSAIQSENEFLTEYGCSDPFT